MLAARGSIYTAVLDAGSDAGDNSWRVLPWIVAALFFAITTAGSWAKWANYEYGTFDLAYYVQALWQLLHGRFAVSILDAPLLGNHVEPIVFAFAPALALFPHPMILVVLQNAALAAMAPIGYDIAQRLVPRSAAAALSAAILLAPAAGYVALHEFHPEALAAPLLLLMYRARLDGAKLQHWIWFCAVLSCKENMALLLVAYGAVTGFADRKKGWRFVRDWSLWPALAAAAWFILCTKVITPALNSGRIDYLALYDRLGSTPGEILLNMLREPHRVVGALVVSITHGNLVTATLLPFLALPLLRPRWLIVAAPILLQHLLSWRSSEWTIEFHYAAPLVPLFWIASVEVLSRLRSSPSAAPFTTALAVAVLLACGVGQATAGPADILWATARDWAASAPARATGAALLGAIPPGAGVVAPPPYLSHLAMRETCYSLHFILKGTKTLSRERFDPPSPPEIVFIDYADIRTFDASAGYYHPRVKTADGNIMPSSDDLLHQFLSRANWTPAETQDQFTVLTRTAVTPQPNLSGETSPGEALTIGEGNKLLGIRRSPDGLAAGDAMTLIMDWELDAARTTFPWLELVFNGTGEQRIVTKGLCAPQIVAGFYRENWRVYPGATLAPGTYDVEAHFFDNPKRAWSRVTDHAPDSASLLCAPVPLGRITVAAPVRAMTQTE